MNTTLQDSLIKATNDHRQAITGLLHLENLPVNDLPSTLDNFFVVMEGKQVVGAIGLEVYGDYGLIRSMVVEKQRRGQGLASHLVQQVELTAKELGLHHLYLLTETASTFFQRLGYEPVAREDVPAVLQTSSEFSHVCPVTAVVMKKPIITR